MDANRFLTTLVVCVLTAVSGAAGAQIEATPIDRTARAPEGFFSCDLTPWDSVDNGMGAEPGVVREFDSGMQVTPACLRDGKAWITGIYFSLTRLANGSPTITLDLLLREPDPDADAVPPPGATGYVTIDTVASGIAVFPNQTTYFLDTYPAPGMGLANVLWGDYQYVGVALDGATTANVFLVADQTGPPGAIPCFTGIGGIPPGDNCLNGNPNLNAAGLGISVNQFYGVYIAGDTYGWEGNVAGGPGDYTFYGRYSARIGPEGLATVTLTEGPGGPEICAFVNVPSPTLFECPLTDQQFALLEDGRVHGTTTAGGGVSAPLIGADAFVFADGFESGDTAAWSATTG